MHLAGFLSQCDGWALLGEESSAMVIGVSGECKIVLVIARSLNLSPGKLGSQCAHAAIGMYRVRQSQSSTGFIS